MARSTAVYVATVFGTPIAAFTVKHELIAWLRRTNGGPMGTIVRRLPDGAPAGRARISEMLCIEELLA